MGNIRKNIFSLTVALCVFSLFSSRALSENNWLKSVKDFIPPGRIAVTQRDVQQDKGLNERAVFMQHSTFFLDRTYIPHIEKTEGHILIQLSKALNATIEKKLKEYGVELLEYLPSNTWKAKIPAATLMEVKAFDFVDAMGDIYPVDKFPRHVLEKGFYSYSYNKDGTVSILVTFHKDIPFNRVMEILAEVSGSTKQEGFITGKRMLLRIPKENLQDLAEYDEVNWFEDRPAPFDSNNADAAALSNIDDLQSYPYNLFGFDIAIGQWEGAVPDEYHPDLFGRVTNIESSLPSIDPTHATHVAGTMIGNGSINVDAKGMAPQAILFSFNNDGDIPQEMSDAASDINTNISVSNHSYGPRIGWYHLVEPDPVYGIEWAWYDNTQLFGRYTSSSQAWDHTVTDTDLVIVKSAGNDRDDTGANPHFHGNDRTTPYEDFHAPDGPYKCIGDIASSKNIITVGAVDDSGGMSTFSSWGPADDGRIKPDIVANGVFLKSTCPPPNYPYCIMSGTSMSAPVVTGTIALIIERYKEVFGTDPSPAMVKALLINTASELGAIGPDYRFGWGVLDARAAVDLIDDGDTYLKSNSISDGEIVEYTVTVPSSAKVLKVTISWTDSAGSPAADWALVNDIDLELIDPLEGIHMPWTLDKSNPSAAATRKVNRRDNVEQVLVDFPPAGVSTVRVKGYKIQGSQLFSLVITMLEEFQVNTYSDDFQGHPSVAKLSDGGFVVTWESRGILFGSSDVYGQMFDSAGDPAGNEFQVNTHVDDNQENPSVVGLSGGGFVVTWESKDQDGENYGVFGQMFDNAGNPVGEEFQANTEWAFRQEHPSVAGLSAGGFVVMWDSDLQDGSGDGVYGKRFDNTGNPVGEEFQVNTYTTMSQHSPSVAGLSGGGFVVTWESRDQDGGGYGVYGQRFDSAGIPAGGEFKVNTYTAMSQHSPSVAGLSGGGFVVTWGSYEQDGSDGGIYGQIYDSTGDPVGYEFQVNTYSDDDQRYPSVAGLSGGGFVVTWDSDGQDGNYEGVYGQIYDSAGDPVSDEFQVNRYSVHSQQYPSVAGLSNDGFVVAWESTYQDGDATGIFGKRLTMTEPCEGNFDGDTDVDGSDLAIFAADFGRTDCGTGEDCEGDFNHDGDVDGSDLAVFAADFGRTDCPK